MPFFRMLRKSLVCKIYHMTNRLDFSHLFMHCVWVYVHAMWHTRELLVGVSSVPSPRRFLRWYLWSETSPCSHSPHQHPPKYLQVINFPNRTYIFDRLKIKLLIFFQELKIHLLKISLRNFYTMWLTSNTYVCIIIIISIFRILI